MGMISLNDGERLFFKDWGKGQPIVFSHGWPLTGDAWDGQMLFMLQNGYRVIAHDRRGHGRSSQSGDNNNMDQYADDLHDLIEHLDLRDAILVGHSTGGGELVRYIGRHGTDRISKLVLVGAVPPLMLKSEKNPNGVPIEVFDGIRKVTADDRSQAFLDFTYPFYGYNRDGAKISEGIRQSFWRQAMMGGIKPLYDCIHEFSEVDFNEDLKKIDVPTLIVHGDDDQVVPIKTSAMLSSKIIPGAELKVYSKGAHGLAQVQQDKFNADLLNFVQRETANVRPRTTGEQPSRRPEGRTLQ
ncbi:MAG TPA: alpha/beta hydrolase [Bdellovibrionales bacterium]|nr:alpha/beta hydrolase [Bdellovibrionales bacterium]